MATMTAPFMRESITEVLPEALRLSSLTKSSILTGRRRIRIIPQTGQTYGANSPNVCNILIQDSAGLLDMQSVVLSFNIQTSNSANAEFAATRLATDPLNPTTGGPSALFTPSATDPAVTAVLDDFAWSVFQRITISLNSQLVDDLDHAGRRATTEVYASASPSWYNTIGTVMGAWKYADTAPLSGIAIGSVQASLPATAPPGPPALSILAADCAPATVSYPIKGTIGRSGIAYDTYVTGFAPALPYIGTAHAARALAGSAIDVSSRQNVHSKLYRASKWFKDVFFAQTSGEPLRSLSSAAFDSTYSVGGLGQANEPIANGFAYNPSIVAYSPLAALSTSVNNRGVVGATDCLISNRSWVAAVPGGSASAGSKFSIPMGLLSHLFRQEALFPLRNAGQLVIQIQFQPASNCMYGGGYGYGDMPNGAPAAASVLNNAAGLAYVVRELEVECDIVTAVPEYTAILDQICSRPADQGLAIAFDAHLSSIQSVGGTTLAAANQPLGDASYTLIASKGSENVRSFHATFSPTAGVSSGRYLPLSTFPCYDTKQWQIRVGSVYYPAFPSKGLSKNYMEMLSSMNAPMPSVGQSAICNYDMFRSSTPSHTWVNTANGVLAATANSNLWGVTNSAIGKIASAGSSVYGDPALEWMSDCYIIGYCFDNLKHAESLSHDGLDTRAIAGGMLQLDFTCNALEPFNIYFHIRFTRTIVLADNGVSVVG